MVRVFCSGVTIDSEMDLGAILSSYFINKKQEFSRCQRIRKAKQENAADHSITENITGTVERQPGNPGPTLPDYHTGRNLWSRHPQYKLGRGYANYKALIFIDTTLLNQRI